MRTTHAIGLVLGLGVLLGAEALAQPVREGDQPVRRGELARTRTGQPDAQFEPLFQRDEDGNPIPLEGPADLAALEHNPLVDEEDWSSLRPHIAAWTAKVERIAAENIDLVVELDADKLQDLDMHDAESLMYISDAVSMLASAGSLTDYLREKEALTEDQARLNKRIVNDYQRDLIMFHGERAQKAGGDMSQQMAMVTQATYRERVRDAFWVYERILEVLADHPDAIADALGEHAANVSDHLEHLRDADGQDKSQPDETDTVRQLLAELDYDQQRDLAELALELDESDGGG